MNTLPINTLIDDPVAGFNADTVIQSKLVEINAPADVVWKVLTDLSNYGLWNPYCVRAESTLTLGAPVHMMISSYMEPGSLVAQCEYVCDITPNRLLAWALPNSETWPYPSRRDQHINPTGTHSCTYYSTNAYLGQNGIHAYRFTQPWMTRAFNDTADALKIRSETLAAST